MTATIGVNMNTYTNIVYKRINDQPEIFIMLYSLQAFKYLVDSQIAVVRIYDNP